MKTLACSFLVSVMAAAAPFGAGPLVVTATNASPNQLLVYDTAGHLLQTLSTGGNGGVSGNAGGIAVTSGLLAVVNFGSQSVTVFSSGVGRLVRSQTVPAASSPVSVAFGQGHLYILGTTKVESHLVFGRFVNPNPDGVVNLLKADGTAAQVSLLPDSVIITEKSNTVETVKLLNNGAVAGVPTSVMNIPSNIDTPFGMATRGDNAYVTLAHADETSLVRNGTVLTTTGSGTQHSPCWLALDGPFLYASNSPSMSISRYAVYGQKIVQDAAVAAMLNGAPTDITAQNGLVAVIDGAGAASHLTIFQTDEDGNLNKPVAININAAVNGIGIVPVTSIFGF